VFQKLLNFLENMHTAQGSPVDEGSFMCDSYEQTALLLLCEAAAVSEEHWHPLFALVNRFEHSLQVHELLVLRFPGEEALDVRVKVILVDIHFLVAVCISDYLFVAAIGVFGHQLRNNYVLQPA
jgi:hypothetical protein